MLFNSFEFLIFFPVVLALYFLLPQTVRAVFLLAASCFFYMFFKPEYILILFIIITIDFFAANAIHGTSDQRLKKRYLLVSIISNLVILAIFKYYDFINDNITGIYNWFGHDSPLPDLSIILPVGLSFHTFQAMGYTIDVYRGELKPQNNFTVYALYEMFFPQLVAGPIERAGNIIPQFYERHSPKTVLFSSGLRLMLWGFFKKVVIADNIASVVAPVYDAPERFGTFTLISATVLFAIQIYCDFSGYSDIARGTARMMGFSLMENFRTPFLSKSVTEFWRRWHISLSTWFNDYLYMPFILKRREWGKAGIVTGLLLTFSLSGLWHGAGWTFVIYGLLHGKIIVYEFLTKKFRKKLANKIPGFVFNPLTILLTFFFFAFTMIFFRSENGTDSLYIVQSIFGIVNQYDFFAAPVQLGFGSMSVLLGLFLAFSVFIVGEHHLLYGKIKQVLLQNPALRYSSYFLIALAILVFANTDEVQFIYFQF